MKVDSKNTNDEKKFVLLPVTVLEYHKGISFYLKFKIKYDSFS